MDEKQDSHQKPSKPAASKIKDLYNAYVRNEGSRTIPVTSSDSTKNSIEEAENYDVQDKNLSEEGVLVKRDDLENLITKNDELEKEINDLKEQLLRKAAEMENFRRRTLLEKQQMIDYGNERLLSRFLNIIDDFSNALEAGKKTDDHDSVLTGLEMIYQKTMKFLVDSGVTLMENSAGKPFDVHYHEAVMMMPSEIPEGYVVQEVQTGYMIQDKVLRHAKVITSSGMPQD